MTEKYRIIEEHELADLLKAYWRSLKDEVKIWEQVRNYPEFKEKEDYTLWEE